MSTWTFSQKVRQVFNPRTDNQSTHAGINVETYKVSLQNDSQSDPSTYSLPPKDYITHLAQTADYHLNANCLYFNLSTFIDQRNETIPKSSRTPLGLCEVKVLLIIALGKLFLGRGATSAGPPGIREYMQAVQGLPTNPILSQDPLVVVEIFCLLAIYSQAADMHNTAYLYVSICTSLTFSKRMLTLSR